MVYFQLIIIMLIWLPIYFVPFYIIAQILRMLSVSERWRVFFSISIMGVVLGFLTSLSANYREFWFNFNMLPMWLGDNIAGNAYSHFADLHSYYGGFKVPWILRIPQVYLLTTAPIWSLIGLVVQSIYNLAARPPAIKNSRATIMGLSLLASFCLSFGVVYALQNDRQKFGPSEPEASPIMEVSIPSITPGVPYTPPPLITYAQAAAYSVSDFVLSKKSIIVGQWLEASAVITNRGTTGGMAQVYIQVDGKPLSSQNIALAAGESKIIRFMVSIPKTGTYSVSIGTLKEKVEVV